MHPLDDCSKERGGRSYEKRYAHFRQDSIWAIILVVYLCIMFAGGLFGMIYWFFADPSKLAQFAFNFAVGLIGLISLFYRNENDNMIAKP